MIEEQIDDETAPRGSLDLAGAVLGGLALAAALGLGLDVLPWLAAALPMLALGALVPRVPSDQWWRLPVVLALALLPAGWAIGSDAPLMALTLLAALLVGTSISAWVAGRRP